VLAQISGGHCTQGPESSEAKRQATSLHIIPKWEDVNIIIILKIILVRFGVITKNPEPKFLFYAVPHLHRSP
jgi:hypothetical protein